MTTKDVQGWTPTDWQNKVTYVKPSGGGAVGVAFVFTQPGANAATPIPQAAFVVKPMQGSGAATKFAEHVLGKIANTNSPNSKPILNKSQEGIALLNTLKIFRMKEQNEDVKERWQAVMPNYSAADHFLIQDLQVGIQEFGDVYREEGGLSKLLANKELMTNLGKLFAADAFIGNGDRLFNLNTGNIVFKADGSLCAIDSATILTSFEAVQNMDDYTRNEFPGSFVNNNQSWAKQVVGNKGGIAIPSQNQAAAIRRNADVQPGGRTEMVAIPPSFGVAVLFDVDNWWDQQFKSHLETSLQRENERRPANSQLKAPGSFVWAAAKMAFKSGVELGLKQVDSKLSRFNWINMKSKYKSYVEKYGGDANLDWTNLKVRRLYYKARKKGLTDIQAMAAVNTYVNRKLPG